MPKLKLSSKKLEALIRESLADFYKRRVAKLNGLDLTDTLKTKNPYLFRAKGIQNIIREDETTVTVISVKSGPNWGNADQWKRQKQNFESMRHRLQKLHKRFDPVLGYGYGRRNTDSTPSRNYRQRSGQAFWEELTGDPDFYLKLMRLMKDYPQKHRKLYQTEWNKAVNRFEREFLNNFSTPAGEIDWEKFVEFNSSKDRLHLRKRRRV